MNFGESAATWESDKRYTSLNNDETRMDADGGTSIDQGINIPGSDLDARPGISSLALTESSGFGSPRYSNEHDSHVENALHPIRDPETCPIAPADVFGMSTIQVQRSSSRLWVRRGKAASQISQRSCLSQIECHPFLLLGHARKQIHKDMRLRSQPLKT